MGHVSRTTGADQIRNSGGENNSGSLDGTGIGIAVLDSGVDTEHHSFLIDQTAFVSFTAKTLLAKDALTILTDTELTSLHSPPATVASQTRSISASLLTQTSSTCVY